MPLSVEELRDLVRLLEERPEWRAELRRLLLTDELLSLPQVVRELVEAQRRTEARIAELAEAQARTEERVARLEEALNRLAEAQARTEQRVGRLEEALNRLAEAQARTEARVADLAEALARTDARVADLNSRVGYLANLLGADIEADAEEVLLWVLRGKGYQLGEPIMLDTNDGDIDVALPVVDPAGRQLWALVEAKVRVRRGEVLSWARRLRDPAYSARLGEKGITGPYLAYVFGLRVYEGAVAVASEHGVGVLNVRGERLSPVERV